MITGSAPARIAPFGAMPDGTPVEMHTLTNASGMEVCFASLGGIIGSIKVPDRDGIYADVTPGYDHLHEYLADRHYLGALVGRFANRIANAHFTLDGKPYLLQANDGPNLLHGGAQGFNRVVWDVVPFESEASTGAVLSHTSCERSGFPGKLNVRVTYTLTDDNELIFDYWATTDKPTPVNLTQHLYLNLGGHSSGSALDHELMICASRYLPIDEESIPTGELAPVEGTAFDFLERRSIREAMNSGDREFRRRGYDHNFVLDSDNVVAKLVDPFSGRCVEIQTSEPGLQFYSGNHLGRAQTGKEGISYSAFDAVALETQHFPDSPNVPHFPSTILRPGETLRSRTIYRFGIERF